MSAVVGACLSKPTTPVLSPFVLRHLTTARCVKSVFEAESVLPSETD